MSGCDIEAAWSLWSGTAEEDGLFSFEDSRRGSHAKHVLVSLLLIILICIVRARLFQI